MARKLLKSHDLNGIHDRKASMRTLRQWLFLLVSSLASGVAGASTVVMYDDFDGGLTYFNATVATAGAVTVHDQWAAKITGTTANRGSYSISRTSPGELSLLGYQSQYYVLVNSSPRRFTSGYTVRIDPGLNYGGGTLNSSSGLTLSFTSGINAIGFEVGDWGTCCQPSKLYMRFDQGTPMLVGTSQLPGDTSTLLTNHGAGVFVAAFDAATPFKTVEIWGTALGEELYVGGTVHFAAFPAASLTAVPLPGTLWLLGSGLVGLLGLGRQSAPRARLGAGRD